MKRRLPADVLAAVHAELLRLDGQKRPVSAWEPGGTRATGDRRLEVRAQADDGDPEVYLYDEISWWGINADDMRRALAALGDVPRFTLRINSPGGNAFDGVAIYNAVLDHPARVHVIVDGIAASAASVVAMAGDEVTVNSAGQLMIHDASTICWGNQADMLHTADTLGRVSLEIARVYADRCGGDEQTWRDRMLAETWYSGPEAVEAGLADHVIKRGKRAAGDDPDEPDTEPANRWDLSIFAFAGRKHAPAPTPVPNADPVPTLTAAAPQNDSHGDVPGSTTTWFDPAVFRAAVREGIAA